MVTGTLHQLCLHMDNFRNNTINSDHNSDHCVNTVRYFYALLVLICVSLEFKNLWMLEAFYSTTS